MIAPVAALVVSKPTVEVTTVVPVVEPIVASLLGIFDVFASCPPHVGITLQRGETLPSPLVVDLLLQLIAFPVVSASVGGHVQERVGRHGGGGG